jgi:thiosulfate/3-mercaptopyruvate sulfurtransferase
LGEVDIHFNNKAGGNNMKRKVNIVLLAVSMVLAFSIAEAQAAHADALVSTEWVAEKLDLIKNPNQTNIRLVDVSKGGYVEGHIPGAVHQKWGSEVFAPESDHMVMGLAGIERVLRKLGVTHDTHIVLYDGDGKTHHVTRAYWTLKYWHISKVSIMDGGKAKWKKEGRPLTTDVTTIRHLPIEVKFPPNTRIRAKYSPEIISALATGNATIIDSRPEAFYKGEVYTLTKWVRSGHIPGAINVVTMHAMNKDKTYQSVREMKILYEEKGITPDKKIITYCDTGVLASHAWFVLSELLGYKDVMVYDGSMREYANRFDTPRCLKKRSNRPDSAYKSRP